VVTRSVGKTPEQEEKNRPKVRRDGRDVTLGSDVVRVGMGEVLTFEGGGVTKTDKNGKTMKIKTGPVVSKDGSVYIAHGFGTIVNEGNLVFRM